MKPSLLQNRRNYIYVPIVILLLLLLTANGYRLHQLQTTQTRMQYQAEAIYQQHFGNLRTSIQTMHHQLAQLLITSSAEQQLYGLASLWREVYAAINALGSLPVTMHELEQTDLLLHDIAEYSYYLMKETLSEQPAFSNHDWNQLEAFYHRTSVVEKELATLESKLLSEPFYLAEISLEDEENPFYVAFHSIESQIASFPAIEFEEGVRKIAPTPRPITDAYISQDTAIKMADQFLQNLFPNRTQSGTVSFTVNHADIPIYGISYPDNQYIEISQNGGHVLQYYHAHTCSKATYTPEEIEAIAVHIIQQLQLPNLVCVERTIDEEIANFIFVPKQDNVYLYPDMIKVQLSLDDGTLLGLDLTNYQTRQHSRILPLPTITEKEILKNLNPNFAVTTLRLSLIMDSYSERELLCYEIRGNIINEEFSIFLDAHTGKELRIVHL